MPLAKAQVLSFERGHYFPIMTFKNTTAYPCHCLFSLKTGLWHWDTLSQFLGAISREPEVFVSGPKINPLESSGCPGEH